MAGDRLTPLRVFRSIFLVGRTKDKEELQSNSQTSMRSTKMVPLAWLTPRPTTKAMGTAAMTLTRTRHTRTRSPAPRTATMTSAVSTAFANQTAFSEEPQRQGRRSFSAMADRCNLHLIHSPSPPIPPGPYPPIFEFVTQQWSQQSKITSASAGQASGEKPQPSEAIKPSQVAMKRTVQED